MGLLVFGFVIGFGVASILGWVCSVAVYRNGVTDGYGYAQEPNNPGYQKAGDYLKATMAYRWGELRTYEHSSECGTKYCGCVPDCPKDLQERIPVGYRYYDPETKKYVYGTGEMDAKTFDEHLHSY